MFKKNKDPIKLAEDVLNSISDAFDGHAGMTYLTFLMLKKGLENTIEALEQQMPKDIIKSAKEVTKTFNPISIVIPK